MGSRFSNHLWCQEPSKEFYKFASKATRNQIRNKDKAPNFFRTFFSQRSRMHRPNRIVPPGNTFENKINKTNHIAQNILTNKMITQNSSHCERPAKTHKPAITYNLRLWRIPTPPRPAQISLQGALAPSRVAERA